MFSKQDALNAYQDYAYRDMRLEAETRIGIRSFPVVGGLWPAIKRIGNVLASMITIPGAFVVGYGDTNPPPQMPQIPDEFKGSDLEKSFTESWALNDHVVKTKVEGFEKLLSLDIGGWWKKASVASHADAKDSTVLFPEEMLAQQQSDNSHVASLLARGIGAGLGRGN